MPVLTLHLLRVAPGTNASRLLSAVRAESSIDVIVASQPQYTVIAPRSVDRETLLSQAWDLLLLVQSKDTTGATALPASLRPLIAAEYSVRCGIPSRLLEGYPARNAALRNKPAPAPTGSLEALSKEGELPGGERLEVSGELLRFMQDFERRHGATNVPMTMLNLLSFHPNGKESYARYGRAFVEVAGRRGGDAKLVGNVLPGPANANAGGGAADGETAWHEISIVHYPSIRSFCDMLAGKDYQEINEKYRLSALQDTFLLCTTEVFDPEPRGASRL